MQLRPRTNRLYCQKFNFNTLKPIFISLIIFIPLILSCNDQTAKKRLAGIINSEIKCPTELVAIKDSTHYSNDKFPSAVKLILFYDRQDCTLCHIAHLIDYEYFYNISKDLKYQFRIIPIFTPAHTETENLISLIKNCTLIDTVYIDKKNEFCSINSNILKSNYSTFLVDKNNRVVLVGNPLSSDAMWSLFRKTLDNMLDNDGLYIPE